MRFDPSSAAVMALAVASALTTAWWMDQAGLRSQAQAATPVVSTPAAGSPSQVLKAADGHYWADALIEGRAVRVMVDTGASVVALTRADAARLGLKLAHALDRRVLRKAFALYLLVAAAMVLVKAL